MYMKRIIIGVLCFLFLSAKLYSQDCTLKGKVFDSDKDEPVSFSNAVLISESVDSSFIGAITDKNGFFKIDNIKPGRYHLEISFVGYKTLVVNGLVLKAGLKDVGVIHLKESRELLNTVNVRSTKPAMVYKVDRKVIDAGSFPEANVAMDLLENVPSVQVDFEGKLTYRGDGTFKVYINGNPVPNGEEKLRQLSANKIDKIEVITNPSAKYSSEGTAGIIHVILKKNRLQGYAINTTAYINTRDSKYWNFSIDKKSERGGWYINGNIGHYVWKKVSIKDIHIIDKDSGKNENILNKEEKGGGNINHIELGLNYDITDNDYIDFSANIQPWSNTNFSDLKGNYEENELNENGNIISKKEYVNIADEKLSYQYFGCTANYKHSFNKKKTHYLSAYMDYSSYLRDYAEEHKNTKKYADNIEREGYKGVEKNEIIIAGNVNYCCPLSENTKIEAGMEIETDDIPEVTSVSGIFDGNNIIPFSDERLNQVVDFSQGVYSSYLTFKSEIGKLAYQLGLRVEHTDRKLGYDYDDDEGHKKILAKKNFTDWFPTFHTTYSFSETHQMTISYSKRVDRPNYWSLVPIKQYNDPFTYYTGNSGISPSYTDSYELGYKKSWNKDFIGIEVFAKSTTNVSEQISRLVSDKRFESRPENVGKSVSVGTEIMTGVDIFKWWNINVSTSLYSYKLRLDIDGEKRDDSQFKYDGRVNNIFLLPSSMTLKLDFKYFSPMIYSQSKREAYFFSNFAIKKGFKDNKWLITLSAQDILSTWDYSIDYKGKGYVKKRKLVSKPYIAFKIAFCFDNQE